MPFQTCKNLSNLHSSTKEEHTAHPHILPSPSYSDSLPMILSPNKQFLVYYASVVLSVSLLQNFNILKEEMSTCLVRGTLIGENLALARWDASVEQMRLRSTSWCL